MMTRRAAIAGGLALFIVCAVPLSRSQDRAAVVPETKVLLENERVRVQYHDVAVGETKRSSRMDERSRWLVRREMFSIAGP
jgi:hypothetical protein